jgi:hypothetical protein
LEQLGSRKEEIMADPFDFHSSQVFNLSPIKMLIYRTLCAITHRNHEVKISKTAWWVDRHQECIEGLDFRRAMLRQQPSDWNFLIPVEINTWDARVFLLGIFLKENRVVRVAVTTGGNDAAIDFDLETGQPKIGLKLEDLPD